LDADRANAKARSYLRTAAGCNSFLASTGLFLLFLLFQVDDFAPLVMTAIRANRVGQAHFAAIAALNQGAGLQAVVRPPPVPASRGMFALWMWCHVLLLLDTQAFRLKRLVNRLCELKPGLVFAQAA